MAGFRVARLFRCKRIAFLSCRRKLRSKGVYIHDQAKLLGFSGIAVQQGTVVAERAVIAATNLQPEDDLYSPPWGSITIGKRCFILNGAIVASYGGDIVIGDDVSVNPYTILYGHGGLQVGSGTRIAAHTIIIPANHNFSDPNQPIANQGLTCLGIRIGSDVWIGAGVRILDGVRIGDKAVVGAGSVVTRDVPSGAVVAGVPARIMHYRSRRSSLATNEDFGDAGHTNV